MALPWATPTQSKIFVLGDLILDEYIDGDVSRISPEAPVPVHQITNISYSLGGAANTARNIKLCGGSPLLIGALGCDNDGIKTKELLKKDKISWAPLFREEKFLTTKKTRVTSLRQQLLRLDSDQRNLLEKKDHDKIFTFIKKEKPSVIVLSDYQKGFFSKNFLKSVITLAQDLKIKIIVDPKLKDFSVYKNCDLITPNLKEAREALGNSIENDKKDWKEICLELRKRFSLKDILLTLGPEGMFYSKHTGETFYEKARAKEVYDVSGAGDTVVAIMALCLASQTSEQEAIFYANRAAGIAVSKWKTQAVTKKELERFNFSPEKTLFHTLEEIKSKGKKIVFTNGCFDLLHYGHISYLEKAKSLGDFLIIGINTNSSVKRLKGNKRPFNTLEHRKKILESLRFVDLVIPFEEDTPEALIKKVSPDILVKGADYKKENIVGFDHVTSYGGFVETINFVEGLSSSSLLEKMNL